jgi:hypothetical protein
MAKAWLATHIFASVANKLRPDEIENVITAEKPNKDVLHDTVGRHMIHWPYGDLNHA